MEIGVKEAAALLHVSTKTIYRWVTENQIPYFRVGSQYRFSRGRLQEWLLQHSAANLPPAELPSQSTKAFDLKECIESGGIHYRVSGDDVPSSLHEALALTRLPEGCNRTLLWELLLAREALCSTGIGHGIAMAHPRHAALADLPFPMISIHFLENPVDFRAIDGEPVSVVILILSPSTASHLRVMSALGFALRQPGLLKLLHQQASRANLLKAFADCDQRQKPSRKQSR
jgi:nitrogen PTS system EIIA component